jgi:hypothetical protein
MLAEGQRPSAPLAGPLAADVAVLAAAWPAAAAAAGPPAQSAVAAALPCMAASYAAAQADATAQGGLAVDTEKRAAAAAEASGASAGAVAAATGSPGLPATGTAATDAWLLPARAVVPAARGLASADVPQPTLLPVAGGNAAAVPGANPSAPAPADLQSGPQLHSLLQQVLLQQTQLLAAQGAATSSARAQPAATPAAPPSHRNRRGPAPGSHAVHGSAAAATATGRLQTYGAAARPHGPAAGGLGLRARHGQDEEAGEEPHGWLATTAEVRQPSYGSALSIFAQVLLANRLPQGPAGVTGSGSFARVVCSLWLCGSAARTAQRLTDTVARAIRSWTASATATRATARSPTMTPTRRTRVGRGSLQLRRLQRCPPTDAWRSRLRAAARSHPHARHAPTRTGMPGAGASPVAGLASSQVGLGGNHRWLRAKASI